MKLIMLGTGNASATECYNSCFLLKENERQILVDGGGGSTIFNQLKKIGLDWKNINEIIVTHKHMDHLIGVLWLVRMICQHINRNEYQGNVNIYSHEEVIFLIKDFMKKFLERKDYDLLEKRLFLVTVNDNEKIQILNKNVIFFDIQSKKAKQFGFTIEYEDNKFLTCCGDEPYNDINYYQVKDSEWLIHEAFCLKKHSNIFKPYEKNHSTVEDASRVAEELNVKKLVLYHTEDKFIKNRKKLYYPEAKKYFSGKVYIPQDLEEINL